MNLKGLNKSQRIALLTSIALLLVAIVANVAVRCSRPELPPASAEAASRSLDSLAAQLDSIKADGDSAKQALKQEKKAKKKPRREPARSGKHYSTHRPDYNIPTEH